jgi:hypothetical protein
METFWTRPEMPTFHPPKSPFRLTGESSSGPLVAESDPAEWSRIYDAFQEAREIGPQEAVLHQDMLDTYAPKSGANQTKIAPWERHDKDRQYYARIPSRVKSGVSLPFFAWTWCSGTRHGSLHHESCRESQNFCMCRLF